MFSQRIILILRESFQVFCKQKPQLIIYPLPDLMFKRIKDHEEITFFFLLKVSQEFGKINKKAF